MNCFKQSVTFECIVSYIFNVFNLQSTNWHITFKAIIVTCMEKWNVFCIACFVGVDISCLFSLLLCVFNKVFILHMVRVLSYKVCNKIVHMWVYPRFPSLLYASIKLNKCSIKEFKKINTTLYFGIRLLIFFMTIIIISLNKLKSL